MIYKTHAAFGVALAETAGILGGAPFAWQTGAAVVLAAVVAPWPDIDKEGSWISQRVPVVDWFAQRFQHRTLTHSILVSALLYILLFGVWRVPHWIAVGVWIGWISHPLIDLLNPQGVHLLWPFSKKLWVRNPVPFLTIEVGGVGEEALERLLRAFGAVALLFFFAQHIPGLIAGLPLSGWIDREIGRFTGWAHFPMWQFWIRKWNLVP